tara:strand:- start:240 stop:815 length:576 start_codon:yes stop_codon:yes gene_type:complete
MNSEDLLKDLKYVEEEPEEKPSKLKKVWLVMVSIFLVLLMISFIFVTFPIGDIIQGKVESNLLKGDVIDLDDFKIYFEDNLEEVLESYYFNEQEVEISLCLEGYREDDRHMTSFGDYFITSLYEPSVFSSAYNHVSFEPCSKETVLILHTHPYKRCVASDTDLETLEKSKLLNEDVLMVVMCEPSRFSVYS